MIDQRKKPDDENGFLSLGVHAFDAGPCEVIVTNAEADGFVVADAVQFLLRKS